MGKIETMDAGPLTQKLARECAPLLGDGWSYDAARGMFDGKPTVWADLVHTDGRRVVFHLDSYRGKLSISGVFQARDAHGRLISLPYAHETPAIKVDAARSPEAIAKDMARRFMPKLDAAWKVYRETVGASQAHDSAVAQSRAALLATGVLRARTHNNDATLDLHVEGAYGTVQVHADSADLKLSSLTITQAVAVLRVLSEV